MRCACWWSLLTGYSKFAQHHYAAEGLYPGGTATWLMFGAETTGLPEEAHHAATHMAKIPMSERYVRSLNLATSVGEYFTVVDWLHQGNAVGCACAGGRQASMRHSATPTPEDTLCAGIGVMEVLRQKDGAVLPEDMGQ
jgi:hypothetical protein